MNKQVKIWSFSLKKVHLHIHRVFLNIRVMIPEDIFYNKSDL